MTRNLEEVGKVAVMVEPEKLEYQEYKIPSPEQGAVVLKVLRTNICGSELPIWKGQHPTKRSGVLGHEMVGKVHSLGKGVETDFAGKSINIGDRVVATYFTHCMKCKPCQEGLFNLCEKAYYHWNQQPEIAPHFHGSYATHYYIHPNQYFYKVPDNISDMSAASVNCALSQVYYGIEKAELKYGESLVIQGAGGLGLNACAIGKEKGANVIVIDALDNRLEQARKFGADQVININDYKTQEERTELLNELTDGGADVGLELTGNPAAFTEGIHLIKAGGRYVSIGNITPGKMVSFDPGLLTRKSITVIPVVRYQPWYLQKALNFLTKNISKYPFDDMLDREFALDEIEAALEMTSSREVTRASIVFEEGK